MMRINTSPWKLLSRAVLVLALVAGTVGPAAPAAAQADDSSPAEEPEEPPTLLGEVERPQIEAAEPEWVEMQVESEVDEAAVLELANVEADAEVVIYFGTWCSDSAREISRLWHALDLSGGEDLLPFTLRYLAVDRADKRPPELERDLDLRFVPTFLVLRGGEEVGRIVESSPNGIEKDLLALLNGTAEGVLSGRDDL